jgi:hypothetical protein
MELTARQIVDIFAALNTMQFNCRLKYRDARKLSDLKKLFKDRSEIIGQMERELVKKSGGVVGPDGKIQFDSPQTATAFLTEHEKLFEEKDEVEFTPVDLSDYIDNVEITVEGIEALDGIILFKED